MNIARFYRAVYHDNKIRRQNRRSYSKDLVLYGGNRLLQPLDRALCLLKGESAQPLAFILGAPRSGTTLLFQLIAQHLDVGYPSNYVARFFISPAIGTWRYLRRFRGEDRTIPLSSEFGGTDGPHSPHEFSWFWEFHTASRTTDDLSDEELDSIDWTAIRRQIGTMANLHRRPYVFKSLNYTVYNVARFAEVFPSSRFIYIRRDPRFVVQSILECRVERYGDESVWWTIRPRDVENWRDREPLEQVCHQVADIQRGIEEGLAQLPERRKLVVDYEDLVDEPWSHINRVAGLIEANVVDAGALRNLKLRSGNIERMNAERLDRIPELLQTCR